MSVPLRHSTLRLSPASKVIFWPVRCELRLFALATVTDPMTIAMIATRAMKMFLLDLSMLVRSRTNE